MTRRSGKILLLAFTALLASGSVSGAAPAGQDVPFRCGDLFALTTQVAKRSDMVTELGDELDRKHWRTLNPNYSPEEINAVAAAAAAEADARVAAMSGLDQAAVQGVFARGKSILVAHLKGDAGLPAEEAARMIAWLEGVTLFRTPAEFVAAKSAYERPRNGSLTEAGLIQYAYGRFRESCGRNGLTRNAFYDDQLKAVVACPGLRLGLHDYTGQRQDQLDALAFALGHELGHALDWSTWSHVFTPMGECYRLITAYPEIWSPGLADEITADHWGALVLSEVLAARPGGPPPAGRVVEIIAYATDQWDDPLDEPGPHPPSQFRVNQTIARHPGMVALLGCPANGPNNPTCTLQGIVPEGWQG